MTETNSPNDNTPQTQNDGSRLLQMVNAVSIKPEDAAAVAKQLKARMKKRHKHASDAVISAHVADAMVKRYSLLASIVGGSSGLVGIVPGLGTILAATAGASTDAVVCMKLQVDMCMCMCAAYGYDITSTDAQHLSLLIAAGGTLEKAGASAGTKIATQAGVKMMRQYLKGATLQAVKEFFKKIGITFTRKAAEKAIPFGVGTVIGAVANYALTHYVGKQAKKWFILDAETDGKK